MESGRILGQNHIIKHFENAIKMGKISHAYIINGEAGSGKMKLAVHFAKALQCEANNPDTSDGNMQFDFGEGTGEKKEITGVACGHCKSCHQTDSGNQPDIIHVTHEKPNSIGVDDVREQLVDDIVIKPYSSKYKIYIIDEAEKLTVQAQNAILKTIEVFI